MIALVLQRRTSRLNPLVNLCVLAGLIIPPAVVPTIWVMQALGLFKTMPGLILIEVAFGLSFTVLIIRAFVATIPRELDEAAIIDGAGPLRLFFRVIFPLLRSVIVTIIVVQSVFVFNDFQNPLYFLPGDKNATVQLTLYNFQSQSSTSYNLLFTNILLITIPPLIMYIFFNSARSSPASPPAPSKGRRAPGSFANEEFQVRRGSNRTRRIQQGGPWGSFR